MKGKVYYSAQTEASLNLFDKINGTTSLDLIYAIVLIKKAAAWANFRSNKITKDQYSVITKVCDKILKGEYDDQFVTSALQGGAGTSINTNVNEVISGISKYIYQKDVHPNDHVNASQSTNDVVPSALRILSIDKLHLLKNSLLMLIKSFEKLSLQYNATPKLARTHMQDAIPVTFGKIFSSYKNILKRDLNRIDITSKCLFELNLGGTAIGTGINTNAVYLNEVYKRLNKLSGLKVKRAKNAMSLTSSSTDFLEISNTITLLHNDLSKIADDIRFLASGPKGGIGEIKLHEYLDGSTIMPGKVNPVVPEFMNQIYFYIAGKTLTIQLACESANLELSIMLPVIADSLISILDKSIRSINIFDKKCIKNLKVDKKRTKELLDNSFAYATLHTPLLGYDKVKELVKTAIKEDKTVREIALRKRYLNDKQIEEIIKKL